MSKPRIHTQFTLSMRRCRELRRQLYDEGQFRELQRLWFVDTPRLRVAPHKTGYDVNRVRGYVNFGARINGDASWGDAVHEMAHFLEAPIQRLLRPNFRLRMRSVFAGGRLASEPLTFQSTEREIRTCAIQYVIMAEIDPYQAAAEIDKLVEALDNAMADYWLSPAKEIFVEKYARLKQTYDDHQAAVRAELEERKRTPTTKATSKWRPPPDPGKSIRKYYLKTEIYARARLLDVESLRREWFRRAAIISGVLRRQARTQLAAEVRTLRAA